MIFDLLKWRFGHGFGRLPQLEFHLLPLQSGPKASHVNSLCLGFSHLYNGENDKLTHGLFWKLLTKVCSVDIMGSRAGSRDPLEDLWDQNYFHKNVKTFLVFFTVLICTNQVSSTNKIWTYKTVLLFPLCCVYVEKV